MTESSADTQPLTAPAAVADHSHAADDPCGCGHDHHDHHHHDHHHHHHGHHHHAPVVTYQRSAPKIGRNDACLCGSGKKYKKCCLSLAG